MEVKGRLYPRWNSAVLGVSGSTFGDDLKHGLEDQLDVPPDVRSRRLLHSVLLPVRQAGYLVGYVGMPHAWQRSWVPP